MIRLNNAVDSELDRYVYSYPSLLKAVWWAITFGIVYIFSSYFFISSPLFNFVFVLYVFTAAFCQQFIKEYDDDDEICDWGSTVFRCRRATCLFITADTGGNSPTYISPIYQLSTQVRPKLHYTDILYNTTNGHQQWTSSQQFYNKFATSQCQSPTSWHVKMLGCGKFLSVGGEFVVQQVVELLWACPLVVSVVGVRV